MTTLAPCSVSCAPVVRNTLRDGFAEPFAVLTALVPMSAMTRRAAGRDEREVTGGVRRRRRLAGLALAVVVRVEHTFAPW